VPLVGGAWTQGVAEADELIGEVTFESVTQGSCALILSIRLDGRDITAPLAANTASGTLSPGPVAWKASGGGHTGNVFPLLDNGAAAVPHVLTAQVSDTCSVLGQHYVLKALSIDILAAR
jgi:hypothetical protein